MRKFCFALLFVSGIILTSCNNKKASLQFEKDVMYEIYPALIDTLWVNASYHYVPPPPPHIKDTPEYRIRHKKEYKKQFNEDLSHYKKTGFVIDLLLLDKISQVRQNQDELKAHFKDAVLIKNKISDTLEYKIDKGKFDSYKAFHLTYLPRFPRGNDRLYYNELRYQIRGVFSLSRIQFDDEKNYGVLTAGIECGPMCGYGYRIFIKKVKEKWVVDKIEEAWIS
ncbi:hypothetical protein [Flavobacterium chungangense]|uniref:Lipoprotein n=1 Tax=Flavobacterium chungangense TaxID=554283 RepID=A0A6V6Z933_9FLAO|nr:hypothetical protein [Flavobacterium chungangense]CAD0007432.1 hypothetical protein FLACHUCJ7_03294 [Flavobacterium chungangense]